MPPAHTPATDERPLRRPTWSDGLAIEGAHKDAGLRTAFSATSRDDDCTHPAVLTAIEDAMTVFRAEGGEIAT